MSSTKENFSENAMEPCEICHRFPQHSDSLSMKCSECDKLFHNSTCLAKHFLLHLFWTCGECGRTFDTPGAKHDCDAAAAEEDVGRSRLVPAANSTYVREFTAGVKCTACAKVFVSSAVMEKHLRSHTKERPHACGLCDQRFRFSCQLREHVREHTGEKPFACHLCSRTYSRRAQLRRHVALHSESRLHVCMECERGFTSKESLALHSREHPKTETGEGDEILLPSSC